MSPKKSSFGSLSGGAATLFVGGAFVLVLVVTTRWRGWRPDEAWRWLFHVGAAATVLSALGTILVRASAARFMVAIVTVTTSTALFHTPGEHSLLWQSIAGGGALLLWLALDPLTQRRSGPLIPIGLTIALSACCVMTLLCLHWAALAVPLAAMAAALLMVSVVAWVRPAMRLDGVLLTVIIIYPAAMLLGWVYQGRLSGVSWLCVAGVAISPIALRAVDLRVFNRRPGLGILAGVLAVVVLTAACILFSIH